MKDAEGVADCAAQLTLELVRANYTDNHELSNYKTFHRTSKLSVCLSGGNTPRLLYQNLAAPPYANQFPWNDTHWFWGDERYVPKDHPSSNYGMAVDAMFAHVPIPVPESNVHRMKTELTTPEDTAHDYERVLQHEYEHEYGLDKLAKDHPLFWITFLGLGTDGHTASLFPGMEALQERNRWVTHVSGVKTEPRITLTFPVLNSSKHVIFLVTGEEKREILRKFLDRDPALPAVHIDPAGQLYVIADKAACP